MTKEAALELEPLDGPRSLADDAADVIRERILAGGFQRGEHLVEARIAQQLRVSRGPVREAFKMLLAEGLVAEEPRRGTFVVALNGRDVREIYDLRAAVEGAAAGLVALLCDAAAIAELQTILAEMEAATQVGDIAAIARSDLAFHDGICRLSGNRRIHSVFLQHVPALRTLLQVDEIVYASEEIPLQHRPILEAIASGNAPLATGLTQAHCRLASDKIAAYIDQLTDA